MDQRPAQELPAGTQPASPLHPAPADQPSRKLVRNAQLDLQVKSYQPTVDAITALAKADGGYLDSSSSQRGGNGKLQGSIVAKVLPENLDAFLVKLRDLGEIKNQSVSTEDVTKDYVDTQARLANSRLMETQLQQLLTRDNGKVADLLKVEREIERVRGDIEQMQGQLKLYDFQVQYATVTINVAEKDLHQAAAYLLRESDQFSLFTGNVEEAFAQAKAVADAFKAEILNADLQHDSDNHLSATLAFSVPPDQIDGFLAKVKSLGRVDNFTRQTQRVANDGGDPGDPSDETRTEKDHVQVQLTIRADDESPRQQTRLTVASTGDIDAQAQQLKDDATQAGATVTASNFDRATDGMETAALSFRLPLAKVVDFMPVLQKLGRVESLTVERHDRPDQAAADPGAPAEIDLRLHNVPAVRFENQPPRQLTQLAIGSHGDVDAQAKALKDDALKTGVTVTASNFDRAPDGMETAALSFRLPLAKVDDFMPVLQKLGRVESLTIQRHDGPDQAAAEPDAPAEIDLQLHNVPAVRFADQPPRQQTQLAVVSRDDVDAESQQLKTTALQAGYALTASTFNRSPDGTEQAAMTFRLPLTQAAAFTATLEKLGRVESLAVQRNDVTGADGSDPDAPAEVSLNLHSEPAIIANNPGFWATVRTTFGGAVAAFLGSVQDIGVLVAWLVPWGAALVVLAWGGRRAYVAYRTRRTAA